VPNFVLQTVRSQVQSVLQEIDRLEGSEFPYQHAKDGLDELRDVFRDHETTLSLVTDQSKPDTIEAAYKTAFSSVKGSLDILGFILRSTNVRNAFEVYGPLLRLSRQILGPTTKLIISSEWNFSPFTFIGYEHLPDFVLIGFPATESSNPFLVPLAGHELGHSVWNAFACDTKYRKPIEEKIIEEIKSRWLEYDSVFPGRKPTELNTDFFVKQTWIPAWNWAMRQSEEVFCDFLGLRLFAESYLHASAYLMAPWREGRRSFQYPNGTERSQILVSAAQAYGMNVPPDYAGMFSDVAEPQDDQRQAKFLLSIADEARRSVTSDLMSQVDQIVSSSGVMYRTSQDVERCKDNFKMMVPSQNVACLATIINAAWEALLSPPGFFKNPQHDERRDANLTEIVLKSIEVHEIEQKLASHP